MIQIDSGFVAIVVTIILALLGLAVGYGKLSEKVRRNCDDVEKNREEHKREIYNFREENSKSHEIIYNKLEAINNFIRKGFVKSGD